MGRGSEEVAGVGEAVLRDDGDYLLERMKKWKGRRDVCAVMRASAGAAETKVSQLP